MELIGRNVKIKNKKQKKFLLLELFKGTGSVGKTAKKLNLNVISLDNEAIFKPDILTDILDWNYKNVDFIPNIIWASPPCNTFSPLSYPLKERDTETAEPFSERAKLGTKILYKTIEIINYFKKKNPKLLFVIENPRGMMRKDKKIKELYKETTLYCLYGDIKRKPTDFFSNFRMNLIEDKKNCPNKVKGVVELKLCDRYSIPTKLLETILKSAIDILT